MNILGIPLVVGQRPIPGLTPKAQRALEDRAPSLVREALAAGRAPRALVLHVESEDVTLEGRAELAEHLRSNGLATLARKLDRALVPSTALLTLIDTDGATELVLMPLKLFLPKGQTT